MNFGVITGEASARQIMGRAHEHSINFGVLRHLTSRTTPQTG